MRFSAAVRERVLSMYLARETETMMPNNNKTPRRRRRSSRVPCRLRGGEKKELLQTVSYTKTSAHWPSGVRVLTNGMARRGRYIGRDDRSLVYEPRFGLISYISPFGLTEKKKNGKYPTDQRVGIIHFLTMHTPFYGRKAAQIWIFFFKQLIKLPYL